MPDDWASYEQTRKKRNKLKQLITDLGAGQNPAHSHTPTPSCETPPIIQPPNVQCMTEAPPTSPDLLDNITWDSTHITTISHDLMFNVTWSSAYITWSITHVTCLSHDHKFNNTIIIIIKQNVKTIIWNRKWHHLIRLGFAICFSQSRFVTWGPAPSDAVDQSDCRNHALPSLAWLILLETVLWKERKLSN